MQITPPFGYREVVPFLKTQKVRSVPEFVQRGNAIPISHTEFQLVGRDYPIVFASSDGGKNFAAVAVVGISAGENLFYSDAWARNVYVPAYARRYPFCMAKVTLDKVEQKNRLTASRSRRSTRTAAKPCSTPRARRASAGRSSSTC